MKMSHFKWALVALPLLPLTAMADIITSDQATSDVVKTEAVSSDNQASTDSAKLKPVKGMLPDEFKVYHSEKVGLSTKPFKGGQEKIIPTNNEYREQPGCYLACYSKNPKEAAYHVIDDTYMMGQIRVKGRYTNGMCVPTGYESKDARHSKDLMEQCEKAFPDKCTGASCWIETRTGNWFY